MSGGLLTQPCETCGGDHWTRDHDDARPLDTVRVSLSCGHTVTAYRRDADLPSLYCAGCRKPVLVEGPAS